MTPKISWRRSSPSSYNKNRAEQWRADVAGSWGLWNHNIHSHHVILGSVSPDCRRALDVGCGEGTVTRQLRRVIPEVVGIDNDQASITAARAHPEGSDIEYIKGDARAYAFRSNSFRLITAVASLSWTPSPRVSISGISCGQAACSP